MRLLPDLPALRLDLLRARLRPIYARLWARLVPLQARIPRTLGMLGLLAAMLAAAAGRRWD